VVLFLHSIYEALLLQISDGGETYTINLFRIQFYVILNYLIFKYFSHFIIIWLNIQASKYLTVNSQ
jgi:hypothetical protein